jgi:hypothetical protein
LTYDASKHPCLSFSHTASSLQVIFFTFWQKIVLVALKRYEMLPVKQLYREYYADHNVSSWGDDVSDRNHFYEMSSLGIQVCVVSRCSLRTVSVHINFAQIM